MSEPVPGYPPGFPPVLVAPRDTEMGCFICGNEILKGEHMIVRAAPPLDLPDDLDVEDAVILLHVWCAVPS